LAVPPRGGCQVAQRRRWLEHRCLSHHWIRRGRHGEEGVRQGRRACRRWSGLASRHPAWLTARAQATVAARPGGGEVLASLAGGGVLASLAGGMLFAGKTVAPHGAICAVAFHVTFFSMALTLLILLGWRSLKLFVASASSCRPGPVATQACTRQVPNVYPSAATTGSAPDTASRPAQRALALADVCVTG